VKSAGKSERYFHVGRGKSIKMTSLFTLFYRGPIENTPKDLMKYTVFLPICTVAMTVKAMCKYCGRVFGCDSNLHSQSPFNFYIFRLMRSPCFPSAYLCIPPINF
jgi:hypothetical protein